MTTLVNALEQRGARYGLQTMCQGGGMAKRHDHRTAITPRATWHFSALGAP
jgi:acetyl-CoA acetyltransferase